MAEKHLMVLVLPLEPRLPAMQRQDECLFAMLVGHPILTAVVQRHLVPHLPRPPVCLHRRRLRMQDIRHLAVMVPDHPEARRAG